MWIALICAILFAAGGIYNLVGPGPNYVEAAGGLGFAAALAGVFLFSRREERRSEGFLTWLLQNADAIERGDAKYGGAPIRKTTRVTQYQAALSFLIVSLKLPSAYYIGEQDRFLTAALYTFVSLLLGWWGIPWGPIYTVQAVYSNLTGGKRRTVGELMQELSVAQKAGTA